LIYFPAPPLVLPVQITNGDPIRIELWEGTTKISDVDMLSLLTSWPIPSRNQDFYLKLRAIDQDSNRVWGSTVKVRVRDLVFTHSTRQDEIQQQFSVYPNPAQAGAWLKNSSAHAAHIEVIDITGKSLMKTQLGEHQTLSLPTNSWSSGLKLIMVQTKTARHCLKLQLN